MSTVALLETLVEEQDAPPMPLMEPEIGQEATVTPPPLRVMEEGSRELSPTPLKEDPPTREDLSTAANPLLTQKEKYQACYVHRTSAHAVLQTTPPAVQIGRFKVTQLKSVSEHTASPSPVKHLSAQSRASIPQLPPHVA